ncbi:mitochondrial calcium uniporter regulator 1 isoform X2 [Paramormyrops kingsleyae]|uniref:mitochondrial calcium uniporter regulator 1 isoform X2 n=1 Tax=Paramormyrops kingsleyae TaxID=1676925 RepID=UPI000CD5D3BB|nr:mitochondrial calcium uniporter regulator 1-like isoform X2 [Paramormyrops kingsleyae]
MDMIAVRLGTRQGLPAALRGTSCPKRCVTAAADSPQPEDLGRHISRRASRPDPSGPAPTSGSYLRRGRAGALAGLGYGTFCVRRWCRNELYTGIGAPLSLLKRTVLIARELSTSIRTLQSETAKSENRKFFFDTHAVVRLLENNGFNSQQAEVVVSALMRTTNSNMDVIYKDMVTKVQQEIMLQTVMSHIAAVKKDMVILERSEFSTLLTENEKVKIEVLQLKVQLNDVMNKVRSDTILEMNLEKSRVKEMVKSIVWGLVSVENRK